METPVEGEEEAIPVEMLGDPSKLLYWVVWDDIWEGLGIRNGVEMNYEYKYARRAWRKIKSQEGN